MESFERKHSEPDYALEKLNNGEYGIGNFYGQTRLFIPNEKYSKIGKEKILELAEGIYGKEELDSFHVDTCNWQNSFSLDLPPNNPENIKNLIDSIEEEI